MIDCTIHCNLTRTQFDIHTTNGIRNRMIQSICKSRWLTSQFSSFSPPPPTKQRDNRCQKAPAPWLLAIELKSSAPCITYPLFPVGPLKPLFHFVVLSITYFLYGSWAQPSGKWGLESWPIHHAEEFVKPWSNYPNFFAEWSLLFDKIIWKETEGNKLRFQGPWSIDSIQRFINDWRAFSP